MLRFAAIVTGVVLSASVLLTQPVIAAQAFSTPLPPIDLTWITNGLPATVIAADVYPHLPGDEVVIWLPDLGTVTAAVYHPERSGYMGLINKPGVCYEPWTQLHFHGTGWHIRELGDVTRDGLIDWIWYTENPARLVIYPGTGGTFCR